MISVIIPAHNESAVIARTLKTLITGAAPGELEVIVVCNGCTDGTANLARAFGTPVRVLEIDTASKAQALNAGDAVARGFPRIYVDADVLIELGAIHKLVDRLQREDVLVVAPLGNYDLTGCSLLVRSFFRIRGLLPSSREGIGGSGVYALSEKGRRRFGNFPQVTADDGFVRLHFSPSERETVLHATSTVFPPRNIGHLVAQKTRIRYGALELRRNYPELWKNRGGRNHESLLRLFRNPRLWLSLTVYCAVTLIARSKANARFTRRQASWERDETSRVTA